MKNLILIIMVLTLAGCAALTGKQQPEVPKRIKTLGVLPLLIDADSVEYSNREGLVALLAENSRNVDGWLVEQLRSKGDFFDVRQIEGELQGLLTAVVAERRLVGEKASSRLDYGVNAAGVRELSERHLVDGLLVVVVNGVKRPEKRWNPNSTRFEYLVTDYRSLLYTAFVVDASGKKLWERVVPPGDVFLRLDYPDFSEAYWNRTKEVRVKEISLPGIDRALTEVEKGLFIKTTIPLKYNQMVRELVEQLKKGL